METKIETTSKMIITVKDTNNDNLTRREEYHWSETVGECIFSNDIMQGSKNEKLGNYKCVHYGHDNYAILTDNPIIIILMIKAGMITIDNKVFENMAQIDEKLIDNYFRMTS